MTDANLMKNYDREFYKGQRSGSEQAAALIVPELLDFLPVSSVVDFGCGVGGWLKEFSQAGVPVILGLEGGDVADDQLCIPREHFRHMDFTKDVSVGNFDLALSLEVAEHIPEQFADHFIELLTAAAPIVVFSAAIPGQGGTDHINEKWQSYWCEKFLRRKHKVFDILRPRIWSDTRIPVWYRQNMLIFCHVDHLTKIKYPISDTKFLDVVHPELLTALLTDRAKQIEQRLPYPKSIRGALQMILLSCRVIAQRVASRLNPRRT